MADENQRVIKVSVPPDKLQAASDTLRDSEGVALVERVAPQRLRVTYDINHTGWAVLRERLQAIGAYSQTGLLVRWRDGWREFQEENIRDNLRHKPACCSEPPPGAGSKSRAHRDG